MLDGQFFHTITQPSVNFLTSSFPEILHANGTYKVEEIVTNMAATKFSMSIVPQIPIPSLANLQEIAKAAILTAVEGGGSISCTHCPRAGRNHYPLWIASYWVEVVDIVEESVTPWKQAVSLLEGRMRGWDSEIGVAEEKLVVARKVLKCLEKLRWADEVRSIGKDFEKITSLAHYLTDKWLTSGHINQMFRILKKKLSSNGMDQTFKVPGFLFSHLLIETYAESIRHGG